MSVFVPVLDRMQSGSVVPTCEHERLSVGNLGLSPLKLKDNGTQKRWAAISNKSLQLGTKVRTNHGEGCITAILSDGHIKVASSIYKINPASVEVI